MYCAIMTLMRNSFRHKCRSERHRFDTDSPPFTAPTTSSYYIPPLVNLATQPPQFYSQSTRSRSCMSSSGAHKYNRRIASSKPPYRALRPPEEKYFGLRFHRTTSVSNGWPPTPLHTAQRPSMYKSGPERFVENSSNIGRRGAY